MRIIPITELDARLVDYTDLTDVALRRVREPAEGLYLAESATVIERALAAGHRPRSVLTLERFVPQLEQLLHGHPEVPVYVGDADLLERVTGYPVHRGALASMHRPEPVDPRVILSAARRVVIIEDVVDHTNIGAIMRSCAGLGADAVLLTPRSADPLYRRSIRVSMGTVLQLPWARLPEWPETRAMLDEARMHVAALALTPEAIELDVFAATAPDRLALLLGTEGDGLSRRALAAADSVVRIPMLHGVDSLNVAAAAAVALWAVRPRGVPQQD